MEMTREQAINRIRDFGLYHAIDDLPHSLRTVEAFEMAIKALEQPERTGKWILVTDNNGQHYVCDKCGEWKYHQDQKYCGECGARMGG